MTSEVKKTPKEMKNNKAPYIDNLRNDVIILRGEESVRQTGNFNIFLMTTIIPVEWKEVKMIILHKN